MLASKQIDSISFAEKSNRLAAWFKSFSGRMILEAQQYSLRDILQHTFGYYACQVSVDDESDLLAGCKIGKHFKLVFRPELAHFQCSIFCDPYFWPIAAESVDLVLLHHALDIADEPRRFLHEATTSLISGGKLVIIGFNRLSLHGISCGIFPKRSGAFKDTQFISVRMLSSWLLSLGFKIEAIHYGAYLSPLDRLFKKRVMKCVDQRCQKGRMPFGAFYRIQAARDDHCVTLLKQPWSGSSSQLVGQPVARTRVTQSGDTFE